MNSKEIRERIRLNRLKRGLSQESFARSLGISSNSYSDIEKGKTKLFHPKLLEIARCLDVSIEYLIFGDSTKDNLQEKIDVINENYRRELEELKIEYAIEKMKREGQNKELMAQVETLNNIIGVLQEKRQNYR